MSDTQNKKTAALEKILDPSKRMLILTHDNPDPDAIAASLGFQYFVKSRYQQEARIAFGGIVGRAENQAMIQHLKIPLMPIEQVNFQDFFLVALIDTQPRTGNNSLPSSVMPDIVLDHHPLRDETKKVPFYDVRERVGSCSAIVTSYLREAEIPIQPRLATALYYGIKSDTQDLGRGSSNLDVQNYMYLFPMVQRELLNRILHPKVSPEYFKLLNRAFKRARIHGSALITGVGRTPNPDIVAEIADMLLRHKGVEWVMVTGTYQKSIILSLRTSDLSGEAGALAQSVVRNIGKAGGHGMSAGGKVDLNGQTIRSVEDLLQDRFLKKVGGINQPAEALV